MWRLLLTPPAPGAMNMALDEALMERARQTGEWVFRVYSWSEPTLSLGRNQTAKSGYDRERLAERGIAVVRRPTGGRAILHHHEVTYSVTAPVTGAGDLGESYERINRLLTDALHALGVPVVPAIAPRASTPGLSPCFDHPSAGELMLHGRKLVGSAQWRRDGALLQHGSILTEDDQPLLSSLLLDPALAGQSIPRAATLTEALGHVPTIREVANALFAAVRARNPDATELTVDDQILLLADGCLPHYQDDAWTWRR